VLIEEAVRVQEELRERALPPDARRALVVGGGGGMGGWLCRYFEAQGHAVTVLDPAGAPEGIGTTDSFEDGWAAADLVVLAVPLGAGPDLWDRVLASPPGPLVFDVFSLKSHVADRIREAVRLGHPAGTVHPMFGPSARLLSGRSLVLCDTGSPEAIHHLRELFEATSLSLVEIPLEEHDRRMADVLGLSHAVSLVFARAIAASPLTAEEIAETASTTFHQQARTTKEVAGENPSLYFEIQKLNPHTPEALGRLLAALESLRDEVAGDRRADFAAAMERSHALLSRIEGKPR
jgi:chorismate mutase/prephenate dehydrogenase